MLLIFNDKDPHIFRNIYLLFLMRVLLNFISGNREGDDETDPEFFSCILCSNISSMISYYSDSEVIWDIGKKEIADNAEATKMLARRYRGSYQRPA